MVRKQNLIDDLTFHQLVEGNMYRVVDEVTILSGNTHYFKIELPQTNKWSIFTDTGYFSNGDADIRVYRSFDEVSEGASVPVFNLNTGEQDDADTTVYSGGDYQNLGVAADADRIRPGGAGKAAAVTGEVRNSQRVVASGDDILLEVDNVDGSDIEFIGKLRFYEKVKPAEYQ